MVNTNLSMAKVVRNDEFYTQLPDIENELRHYKDHFKGKIIFCNCDDPTWSNFWRYFHLNFTALGLKKLISTHFDRVKSTYKMEYMGGNDADVEAGTKILLEGNGIPIAATRRMRLQGYPIRIQKMSYLLRCLCHTAI